MFLPKTRSNLPQGFFKAASQPLRKKYAAMQQFSAYRLAWPKTLPGHLPLIQPCLRSAGRASPRNPFCTDRPLSPAAQARHPRPSPRPPQKQQHSKCQNRDQCDHRSLHVAKKERATAHSFFFFKCAGQHLRPREQRPYCVKQPAPPSSS